jgi:Immunity protein Imm1
MAYPCKVFWKWPGSPGGEQSFERDSPKRRGVEATTRPYSSGSGYPTSCYFGLCVETPRRDGFSVVLGLGDGSIVTYDGRGGDPPYFVSLGDVKEDLTLVSYFYTGERSELPASHVIPQELALEALVDSVANEQPSSLIRWYGG